MEFLRRHLSLILRAAVSLILVSWLIFYRIDWPKLANHLPQIDFRWMVISAVCLLPVLILNSYRWQILMRPHGVHLSFLRCFELNMIGQFFNAMLLGTTGGDVVKIFYVTRAVPQQKTAVALSVVIDRAIGMVSLLIYGLILAWPVRATLLSTASTRYPTLIYFFFAVLGILGMLSAPFLPYFFSHQLMQQWIQRLPFSEKGKKFLEVYQVAAHAWGANIYAFLISLLVHSSVLISGYFLLISLRQTSPYYLFGATFFIVNFLIAIPSSIAGLGVREALFIGYLGLTHIDPEQATLFSLSFYFINLLWSLIGGLVYLLYRHETHEPAPQASENLGALADQ